MERKAGSHRGALKWVLLLLLVVACGGVGTWIVAGDPDTALGMGYIQAAVTGNSWAAELVGDHFSGNSGFNGKLFKLDFQRDSSWLKGAEVTGITSSKEQTLSGQWATVLRFDYRTLGSNGPWQKAALRVKTDRWFAIPFVRAVERIEP